MITSTPQTVPYGPSRDQERVISPCCDVCSLGALVQMISCSCVCNSATPKTQHNRMAGFECLQKSIVFAKIIYAGGETALIRHSADKCVFRTYVAVPLCDLVHHRDAIWCLEWPRAMDFVKTPSYDCFRGHEHHKSNVDVNPHRRFYNFFVAVQTELEHSGAGGTRHEPILGTDSQIFDFPDRWFSLDLLEP